MDIYQTMGWRARADYTVVGNAVPLSSTLRSYPLYPPGSLTVYRAIVSELLNRESRLSPPDLIDAMYSQMRKSRERQFDQLGFGHPTES